MPRMIAIVNLATGSVSQRPSDTPTFDLPGDFDRQTSTASLDSRSQAHYSSIGGKSVSCAVHPRPLSWRVHGEECLVAIGTRAGTPAHPTKYKLYAVDPAR
jgi:hypothetical protein